MVFAVLLILWSEAGAFQDIGIQDRFWENVVTGVIILDEPANQHDTQPTSPEESGNFQWLEFFAGQAEATRSFQYGGYRTGRLDLLYMQPENPEDMNPMDICTDAGMATLGCKMVDGTLIAT